MTNPPLALVLREIQQAVLGLKLHLTAFQIRAIVSKYDPNQPRVPRGRPDGGQWTDGSDAGRTRVAGKYDPSRASICDAQLALDEELCRMAKSSLCWSLAIDRHAACMKNNLVPTLRF